MSILRKLKNKKAAETSEKDFSKLAGFHQSVTEQTDEGLAVVGFDGVLKFVNRAWAAMHGYKTSEELVGARISKFYPEKVANDINRFRAQTKLNGWYIAIVEQLKSNGTTFSGQLKMALLEDNNEHCGILLILSDMSRMTEMQEMVRKANTEIDELKNRLSRLENAVASGAMKKNTLPLQQTPCVLPLNELKQLSDLAKRVNKVN